MSASYEDTQFRPDPNHEHEKCPTCKGTGRVPMPCSMIGQQTEMSCFDCYRGIILTEYEKEVQELVYAYHNTLGIFRSDLRRFTEADLYDRLRFALFGAIPPFVSFGFKSYDSGLSGESTVFAYKLEGRGPPHQQTT